MNYIVPYIDQTYTVDYIVPVAGQQTGVYVITETDNNVQPTASSDDLFKGSIRLSAGTIVNINGQNYRIVQRRLQNSTNWTYESGALVFYGRQHDHMMAMDYQHESGYTDSHFKNLEGWFANLGFAPMFGILVDNDAPDKRTLIFYEVAGHILRNPYLDYESAESVSSIDNIVDDLLFSINQNSIRVNKSQDTTTVSFELNHCFEDTMCHVYPLISVPSANELSRTGNTFIVTYNNSLIVNNIIKFAVYASPICAGTVTVDLSSLTSTLSL